MVCLYFVVIHLICHNKCICIFSNARLNEFDGGHNPRVIALQNRWRTVWRMSVDRKKALEDALDTLLEVSAKSDNLVETKNAFLHLSFSHKFLHLPLAGLEYSPNYHSSYISKCEPPHDKTNKMTASSEDSDQPGHPPSLIRVFTVRMKKPSVLSYPLSV